MAAWMRRGAVGPGPPHAKHPPASLLPPTHGIRGTLHLSGPEGTGVCMRSGSGWA